MRKIKSYLSQLSLALSLIAAVLIYLQNGMNPAFWLVLVVAGALFYIGREGKCVNFVTWKEEYSVGIPSIDEDHKKLLNLINNIQAAVMCNTGKEFEQESLSQLMDYTQYHFQREEELMRTHGYKDYEGHKGQHDQMIIQAKVFFDRYKERGRDALPEVTHYLRLWLLQHINGTDKKYTPFLQEKGVV